MRCPKCGFNNDEDAKFCENCGINLNSSKINDIKTILTKNYLLILFLALIAGIGISAGLILENINYGPSIVSNNATGNYSAQNISNNNNNISEIKKINSSSESNNASEASSDNTQVTTPESSKLISASQAKSIAQRYIEQPGARASTPTLSTMNGEKVYAVPVIYNGEQVGEIWINAQTGAMVGGSGGNP